MLSIYLHQTIYFFPTLLKGELHCYYILLCFAVIGLEWDSITKSDNIYKGELFFSSKTHISTPFAEDIYGLLFTNMNIFK